MLKLLDVLGLSGTVLLACLLAVGTWGGVQWMDKLHARQEVATLKASNAMAQAAIAKQHQERYKALTEEFAKISSDHEVKLDEIERNRRQLVADLRSTKLKLREHYTCPVPTAGQSPGGLRPDEAARLREEDAGASIADADRADAWIISLQRIIRKLENGRVPAKQK